MTSGRSTARNLLLFGGLVLGLSLPEVSQAQGAGGQVFCGNSESFDDTLVRNSVGNLLRIIESSFGAFLLWFSGTAAVFAAAKGADRFAVRFAACSVCLFLTRLLVTLFFGNEVQASNHWLTHVVLVKLILFSESPFAEAAIFILWFAAVALLARERRKRSTPLFGRGPFGTGPLASALLFFFLGILVPEFFSPANPEFHDRYAGRSRHVVRPVV